MDDAFACDRLHWRKYGVRGTHDILNSINGGVDLVSYLGHLNPNKWSLSNLLNSTHIAALLNSSKPTIVLQWGCYGGMYIVTVGSTSEAFVSRNAVGAAASFGATELTSVSSDTLLAAEVYERIGVPGVTIGEAVLQAKQDLANDQNGAMT